MRKLAWFAGSFSAGIFLAQYLLPDGALLPGGFVCLALGIAALFVPERLQKRLVLLFAGLALALGYHWIFVRQVQTPAALLVGQTQTVTMTLCEAPVAHKDGAKVTVRVDGIPGRLVYYGDETLLPLRPGQDIQATVAYLSASRIRDEDVTAFTSKGVFLLAYGRGGFTLGADHSGELRWLPARLGQAMRQRIGVLFSGDQRGLVLAMLTGDRSELSVRTEADLSEAGLYHILAVSGMHCLYLLALLEFLLGHRSRYAAIPVLVCFALMTGGSPSVVRACVMLSMLTLSRLAERDHDAPTALLTALLLILLKNPFAAQSVSLQLSFGAVTGLLWLTPKVRKMLLGDREHGRLYHFAALSVSATIGCLALTAPLSAYYFGRFVTIGVLSNLLCLWLVGGLFVSGLLTVILGFVWLPLGTAAAYLPALLAQLILQLAHGLAAIPYHAVYVVNPYLKYWMLFLYGLFALLWLLRAVNRRTCAVAVGCGVVSLAATVWLGAARFTAPLDAVVLDAGQGQSVLLKSGGQCAVVDCGSSNSWYAPGDTAADWLLTMGCRRLDALVLTHFDADHINHAERLLARIPVRRLLVPEGENDLLETAAACGTEIVTIRERQEWELGGAVLTVFPPLDDGEQENERGLSLLAAAGEDELLITGDMSAGTERKLLETYPLPDLEALVVGHHGAKSATSAELLESLRPEIACISVGKNSYGHPAEEVLRRLEESGCTVYRTDLQGSIHLALGRN